MDNVERELMRIRIAVSVYPYVFESALKPYGHVCPAVTDRANREALEAADSFLKHVEKADG